MADSDLLAEQQRAWRRALSSPRLLQLASQTRVGTTPHDVVARRGAFQLLRYRRETPATHAEPVLFCYALINRAYILDLQPDKSVVRRYLERGFEVYMIDWRPPTDADRGLTLDDYVCDSLADAAQLVLRDHGARRLHLLGYCMGGTMSALFTALEPQLIATLSLLAAPIDFAGQESLLNLWTDRKYFDVDAFIDTYGNCPAWFLQSCFLGMKPVQNLLEKNLSLYENMDDEAFVISYFALEHWINDNVPVAGATFRQFVRALYQDNQLMRGELRLRGQPVDLGRITCPVLLLTARNDHLVPPASTEAIRARVASTDVRSMVMDGGHVGLVVGRTAQKRVWPEATQWLAERSTTNREGRA
jgi:polyhydroxyalkanoate synthase